MSSACTCHEDTTTCWWCLYRLEKEKAERYELALRHIATRKMSTYLSNSHMNQDFIKTAVKALDSARK